MVLGVQFEPPLKKMKKTTSKNKGKAVQKKKKKLQAAQK